MRFLRSVILDTTIYSTHTVPTPHISEGELGLESRDRGSEEVLSSLRDHPLRREGEVRALVVGVGTRERPGGKVGLLSDDGIEPGNDGVLLDGEASVVGPAYGSTRKYNNS